MAFGHRSFFKDKNKFEAVYLRIRCCASVLWVCPLFTGCYPRLGKHTKQEEVVMVLDTSPSLLVERKGYGHSPRHRLPLLDKKGGSWSWSWTPSLFWKKEKGREGHGPRHPPSSGKIAQNKVYSNCKLKNSGVAFGHRSLFLKTKPISKLST